MKADEQNPLSLLLGRRALLAGFAAVALVREARAAPTVAQGPARRWIDGQQDMAEALAQGRIDGRHWAQEVERLGAEIEVEALMAEVRRSSIVPAGRGAHNDPHKRFVRFIDGNGRPRRLAYGAALFDFDPANVITPHGHRHMVSAHMVVGGRLRVRNFDRLGERDGAMLIRPTRDEVARVGHVSTMCAERDNVHWFVPVGGAAATFDIVISGLDAGAPDHLIEAIDPLAGRPAEGGALLAPIIGFEEASRRYTANL
jgi:hypothetical protein